MSAKHLLVFLFMLIGHWSYAQNLIMEGMVEETSTHRPIPFATLGIKGKNIGTVADENGVFHFTADAGLLSVNEAVIVSSVGYKYTSIPAGNFKQGRQVIALIPSFTTLKAVTIRPEKVKTKVFGRTGSSTIMTANMFTERNLINDNLGKEQAAIIDIDKHCFLKDFNMLVAFNRFQSVKFRLNFYNVKDGVPDQLIVNRDILFDVIQRNGWVKVDLAKYNIQLDGYKEIAVAIQWVKSVKNDTVAQSAFGVSVTPVPFHAMYFRNKSQAEWKKISPAYVAFNITADSFKPDKESKRAINEQEELSDSLKNYIAYTKYAREAAASGYGNNSEAGKSMRLPDADIYYEIYGSGESLLLLHGNGSSISSFYKQIPELAKHYKVIAIDTRAQGNSTDKTTMPLTYEKFAEDMKLLLDSLHIRQTNVVGWSDGGNIGLIIAMRYPQYISKLVTMGAVLSPKGVEPALLNQFRISLSKNRDSTQTQYRLLALLVNEPHITDSDLTKIQVPVLVMAGEKDIVLPQHTQEIANHIKRAKLIIIKGATHYAPQEKPEEFNKDVLDFLQQR